MTAAAALQANRGGLPLCHGPGQSIVAAVHPSITHIEPCISRHNRTVAACLRRNGNHRSSKRVDRSSAMMIGMMVGMMKGQLRTHAPFPLLVQWRERSPNLIQVFAFSQRPLPFVVRRFNGTDELTMGKPEVRLVQLGRLTTWTTNTQACSSPAASSDTTPTSMLIEPVRYYGYTIVEADFYRSHTNPLCLQQPCMLPVLSHTHTTDAQGHAFEPEFLRFASLSFNKVRQPHGRIPQKQGPGHPH
ncbi:hypothetical protein HDV57DRAFT_314150 [Trichoderma longibrachiatum]